jgi:hypothetical protein
MDQVRVSFGPSGAAAGTSYEQIDFQNSGTRPCTLGGYPVLTFVDKLGLQIGSAAEPTNLTGEPIATVTLGPGQYANTSVGTPNPGNWQTTEDPSSSTCHPLPAAGLRVQLPGEQNFVIVPFAATVCTTPDAAPLVTPVRAGRSPTAVG